MKTSTRHIGRNVSRLRELRGMKQEALAQAMGVSQQAVSHLENSEEIDATRLAEVAKALGVTVEAIEQFSEENVINFFNSFYDNSGHNSAFGTNNQIDINFNPLDKYVAAQEELKQLYERLLQAEQAKVAYLEALLSKTH